MFQISRPFARRPFNTDKTSQSVRPHRTDLLRFEPLEDRRMLSAGAWDGTSTQTVETFHAQDALFAENAGQWAGDDVYFGYNSDGTQMYFTEQSIEFALSRRELKEGVDVAAVEGLSRGMPGEEDSLYETTSTRFSLKFDGARPTAPIGAGRAETVFNYHVGEPCNWVDGVATYKTVVYDDLYKGIDLHTFSRHGEMKYEFHVAPGADWSGIRLSYEGIDGLVIGEDGNLVIQTELGAIVDEGLYIYQTIGGEETEVAGEFVLIDGDTYAFAVTGEYDPTVELVIDPEIEWGLSLGTSEQDSDRFVTRVAVDDYGDAYVLGTTVSSGWVSGGWDTSYAGNYDGFVAKLDPSGTHLWSTYLGGQSWEYAHDVATDAAGNVYVAGSTRSNGWVSGGWDTSLDGEYDGFLVKLDSSGAHAWSTYVGGINEDRSRGVATDGTGNVYVTGLTTSDDWISGGWDTSYGTGFDGFLVKFDPSGSHLWSTYLGGDMNDVSHGVATDCDGNVYATGWTESDGWVSGGWDTEIGWRDGFLVKLDSAGAHLWSTYLGGENDEIPHDIATDLAGNVYVVGETFSSGWVSGSWDDLHEGTYEGFLVKVTAAGSHAWSTYLGGTNFDVASAVATDVAGNVYVAGWTDSSGWVLGGWCASYSGRRDGFVAKLTSSGTHLWSAYLNWVYEGNPTEDEAYGVAFDGNGNVYVTGRNVLFDPARPTNQKYRQSFVVKIRDRLSGDLTADGYVGSADLDLVRANWNRSVSPGSLLDGDASGDGTVGSADLDIVRANWGAGAPTAAMARADWEDSQSVSAPIPFGPRRADALDAAFASLRSSRARQRLSEMDLATLAEAAWLRELEALDTRRATRGA